MVRSNSNFEKAGDLMNRSHIVGLSVFAVLIISFFLLVTVNRPTIYPVWQREKHIPDLPFALSNWLDIGHDSVKSAPETYVLSYPPGLMGNSGDVVYLPPYESISFNIDIVQTGEYKIAVNFIPGAQSLFDHIYELEHGGNIAVGQLYPIWTDATHFYPMDSFGNEFTPPRRMILEPVTEYLRLYEHVNKQPVVYYLNAGEASFNMTNLSEGIYIHGIYAVPVKALPTYAEYLSETGRQFGNRAGTDFVIIEGTNTSLKSESMITLRRERNPAFYPFDTFRAMAMSVNGDAWFIPGQKVLWEFEIEDAGWYYINFRYMIAASDNVQGNKASFRDIEINGRPLFAEMNGFRFPFTNGNWPNYDFNVNGEPVRIFFEKGRHTISMNATTAGGAEIIEELNDLVDNINKIGMDLKKISAGATGNARTWDMNVYLPDAIPSLTYYNTIVDGLFDRIWAYNIDEPIFANGLISTSNTMQNLLRHHRILPNRTAMLMEGDNSVSASLGSIIAQITRANLNLNRIYIYGADGPPDLNVGILRILSENMHSVVRSFSADATRNTMHASYERDRANTLSIWIRSNQQSAETIRNMVNADFQHTTDLNVTVSFAIDDNTLVLANASGNNPDVLVGTQYELISRFALRDAAYNLLNFDEFLPFYIQHFSLESLVPVSFDNAVYGVVDAHMMHLLYYRTDILEALDLTVPQTWDDVHAMLPILSRYGMSFSLPLSTNVAKTLDTTSPFFFQHGGELWAPDGMSTVVNQGTNVSAFLAMTDLYRVYGAQQQVANFFNSFRYGETPIGIGAVDIYTQLITAAPELTGRWDIALIPGIEQEDGTIRRDYTSAMRACMIFANTLHPEESFRFLRWWLETDTQLQFAFDLRTMYGPTYVWIPGNLDAMRQMYFPRRHLNIIMEQRSWEREFYRHPAWYMLERTVSDAWINVVTNDRNQMVSINRAALETNREVARKLIEFGYKDEQGNQLNELVVDTVDRLRLELGVN